MTDAAKRRCHVSSGREERQVKYTGTGLASVPAPPSSLSKGLVGRPSGQSIFLPDDMSMWGRSILEFGKFEKRAWVDVLRNG